MRIRPGPDQHHLAKLFINFILVSESEIYRKTDRTKCLIRNSCVGKKNIPVQLLWGCGRIVQQLVHVGLNLKLDHLAIYNVSNAYCLVLPKFSVLSNFNMYQKVARTNEKSKFSKLNLTVLHINIKKIIGKK